MLKNILLSGLFLLAGSTQSFGAMILYSFTGATSGAATSYTAPISGVTFGNMSMVNQTTGFTSPGFTAPGTVGTPIAAVSVSSGYTSPVTATGGNNIGTAVSNLALNPTQSAYFSFTLTNASGSALQLDSIGLGARSTGTGATLLSVRSSLDNFASNITTFGLTADSVWRGTNTTLGTPFSLASGDVTFRIYASGGLSTATASTINTRLDDVQLGVSTVTAVPEPTSIALIGVVGAAGISARFRRRGKSVSVAA